MATGKTADDNLRGYGTAIDRVTAGPHANDPADGPEAGWSPVGSLNPHDCHMHMALDGIDWKTALDRHRPSPDERFVRRTLEGYAQAGVTYLRDGGDRFGACELARELAPEYEIEYASPVFPIYRKGAYGSFISRSFSTMEEFIALVDEVAKRGGDFVKIMLSGIMDFDVYGRITAFSPTGEEMAEMVARCHNLGLSVMGHVNGAQAIYDAVAAGVDSIEHGYYSDERSREALASSSTIWVPTLAPVCCLIGSGKHEDEVLRRIAQDQMSAIAQVADMGGTIALGSDAGAGGAEHVIAMNLEFDLMSMALGSRMESVVKRGHDEIRERFGRRTRQAGWPRRPQVI